MPSSALLESLVGMDSRESWLLAREYAHRLGSPTAARSLVTGLLQGSSREQRFALMISGILRDGESVANGVSSDSAAVRRLAISLAARLTSADRVVAMIDHLCSRELTDLFRLLRKHRHQEVLDRILQSERLPKLERRRLARFGSLAVFRECAGFDFNSAPPTEVAQTARYLPTVALEWLEARVSELGGVEGSSECIGVVLSALAVGSPRLARSFWRQHRCRCNLWSLPVRRVLESIRVDVADLSPWWEGVPRPAEFARGCARLRADQRALAVEALRDRFRLQNGGLPLNLIHLLRPDLRREEAEAWLRSPELRAPGPTRAQYLSLIGTDESWTELREWLNSGDTVLRGAGMAGLLMSLSCRPERDPEVASLLRRHSCEPDAFRLRLLGILEQRAHSGGRIRSSTALMTWLEESTFAMDLSQRSAEYLVMRCCGLGPHAESLAARCVGRLLHRFPSIARTFAQASHATALREAVVSELQSTCSANGGGVDRAVVCRTLIELGNVVGKSPALLRALSDCLTQGPDQPNAVALLELLRRWSPTDFLRVTESGTGWSARAAESPALVGWLSRRRPGLIRSMLENPASDRQCMEHLVASGISRVSGGWPVAIQVAAHQQGVTLLASELSSPGQVRSVARFISRFPDVLPETGLSDRDSRVLKALHGLDVLAVRDASRSAPLLERIRDCGHVRSDCVQLPQCLRACSADRALAWIERLPSSGAWSPLAAALGLSVIPAEEATRRLRELWDPGAHSSVRAAICRGLRVDLDSEATWSLFDAEARIGHPRVIKSLLRTPLGEVPEAFREQLTNIFLSALESGNTALTSVILDVLARGTPGWLAAGLELELVRLLRRGTRRDVRIAAQIVLLRTAELRDGTLRSLAELLASRPDLWQRLISILRGRMGSGDLENLGCRLISVLEDWPRSAILRCRIAAATLPLDSWCDYILLVARRVGIHPVSVGPEAIWNASPEGSLHELVGPVGIRLASEPDERTRVLAVWLLQRWGPYVNWPDSLRDLLLSLRGDESDWVAEAALHTVLPERLQEG